MFNFALRVSMIKIKHKTYIGHLTMSFRKFRIPALRKSKQ